MDELFRGTDKNTIIQQAKICHEFSLELQANLIQRHKLVREAVLEDVRKKEFADLPSRTRCIWLTGEKHLSKWKSTFSRNPILSGMKVFEVTLLDTYGIHHADPYAIQDNLSYKDLEVIAPKYWQGELQYPNVFEILFEGKLEFTKQIG